jgi:hypothetical protein
MHISTDTSAPMFNQREAIGVDKFRSYVHKISNMMVSGAHFNHASNHRAPHLLCCRAIEVQKYVCSPDALHSRHPVNAYNEV